MSNEAPTGKENLPGNVFLVLAQSLIPIKKEHVTMGRHVENDLIITDARVSRFHARIDFQDGDFFITDLNSTFGTSVNGVKAKSKVLKNGDTISLANTPLLFIDRSPAFLSKSEDATGMLRMEDVEKHEKG